MLKECVDEYKNLSKEEIKKCLYLGKDGRSIKTLSSRDMRTSKGIINYDVLFNAKLPNCDDDIGLYINVEAQNNIDSNYPLINRAMYYASRLISRQKGEIFTKMKFGKLKKVYSIWVCVTPKVEDRDTIIKYSFQKDLLHGKQSNKIDDKSEYDFINIIMLNVGNDYDYSNAKKEILEMLCLLFKEWQLKSELRVQLLQDKYGIISLNKKEVEEMTTIAQGFIKESKAEGIAIGKAEGIAIGEIKKAVEDILKLLSADMELEKIYSILKPSDEVKKLVEEKLKKSKN